MDSDKFWLELKRRGVIVYFFNEDEQFFVGFLLFNIECIYRINWISHLMWDRSINNCKKLLFSLWALIEDVHADINDFKHVVILGVRLEFLSLDLNISLIIHFIIYVFKARIRIDTYAENFFLVVFFCHAEEVH